jgi:hypothetical protein
MRLSAPPENPEKSRRPKPFFGFYTRLPGIACNACKFPSDELKEIESRPERERKPKVHTIVIRPSDNQTIKPSDHQTISQG